MAATYPVNLDLTGRRVLVIGGGCVAARKIPGLLRGGAEVSVVAPEAVPEIAGNPDIRWFARPYQRGEVASYRLAVTATGDADVDRQVALDGDISGVWVNSADDPRNCSFTLPAVAQHGDLQITISTAGRSPALSRWLRHRFEQEISVGYDQLLNLLHETRTDVRREFGGSENDGWNAALEDGLLELVRGDHVEQARSTLRGHLGLDHRAAEATP